MLNRVFLTFWLALFGLSCTAAEEPAAIYEEGKHYKLITPALRTSNPEKIEISEFFWYGCHHCYTFEPMLQQWKKTLADDVSFQGIPAVWRSGMDLHAQAYYTAVALDVMVPMHQVIFDAMNVDRKPLSSAGDIRALFVANGVSAEDFDNTFSSFGVNSQVRKGVSAARSAKVTGTPSVMVNGKYMVDTRNAGGQAGVLKVVDYLIEKERAAMAK